MANRSPLGIWRLVVATVLFVQVAPVFAQNDPFRASDHYVKWEYDIPMRDGVTLHTVVYTPLDVPGTHPILMERTPYSAGPYGAGKFARFGGSSKFRENGYIFAFQDVRGQYLSQGEYVNVRPQLKPGEKGIDESTDTWDTVDWLLKNVPKNNGSVGLWGISYPGFYAGVGAINTHPGLKAVSPQAPVSDWFIGDDVHHNGAFFQQDTFDFCMWFDNPRKGLETNHSGLSIDRGNLSAYDFYLNAGTSDGLEKLYVKGQIPYWNELNSHPNYDQYWQDRSLPLHFKNVKCAVLTVGGWFDAEDLWGALNLYQAGEKNNPGIENFLVMGPWFHGMWASPAGKSLGDLNFGSNTSEWYRENVEFPFFEKYLRNQNVKALAEATMFATGSNKWMSFNQWPPDGLGKLAMYLGKDKTLSSDAPTGDQAPDAYVNDPAAPTPYIADFAKSRRRPITYMVDDQRFADARADVVSYSGNVLDEDLTVAGPIDVDLWASTTGTDADFIVKVIDVWPTDTEDKTRAGESMAGYQLMIRGDVFRGRFRDSFEKPAPFKPGEPTRIRFALNDLLHTFKKGHRIMIQIQSSWFPLVDRNPNKFVDIYHAKPSDFQRATISIYHDAMHPSRITFGTLTK